MVSDMLIVCTSFCMPIGQQEFSHPNHLYLYCSHSFVKRFNCTIGLRMVCCTLSMFNFKLFFHSCNCFVYKMWTSIADQVQWTTESSKNIFIYKFHGYFTRAGFDRFFFFPLSDIFKYCDNISCSFSSSQYWKWSYKFDHPNFKC